MPKPPDKPLVGLFRPEYNAEAQKLAMLGATDKQMADFFGIAPPTIVAWKQKYPEFFAAIKRGRVQANANVATALYKRAVGYKHKAVKIFMPAGAEEPVYAPYVEHYAPDTEAAVTV